MPIYARAPARREPRTFQEDLKYSQEQSSLPFWEPVYREFFGPDFQTMVTVDRDGPVQRSGIDRRIVLRSGVIRTVDEKARRESYGDILLEYWSNHHQRRVGWVCDDNRQCDYIAYAIVPDRRCYMLPVVTLRRAWDLYGRTWIELGKAQKQGFSHAESETRVNGGSYHTHSVCVPPATLFEALTAASIIVWTGEKCAVQHYRNGLCVSNLLDGLP